MRDYWKKTRKHTYSLFHYCCNVVDAANDDGTFCAEHCDKFVFVINCGLNEAPYLSQTPHSHRDTHIFYFFSRTEPPSHSPPVNETKLKM